MKKIILDLCGGTGSWSKYYDQDPNYEVIIVDPQEWANPKNKLYSSKFICDVRLFEYTDYNIYGILCAPPCTEFA